MIFNKGKLNLSSFIKGTNGRGFFGQKLSLIHNYTFLSLILLSFILITHLLELGNIPLGFYQDETAIGYNAETIAEKGVDEYGVYFPVYFKSFGDYKNPIYIYAVALIFKLFGISEFNLRFGSFLFYIIALFFTVLLTRNLFPKNKIIQIYTLISCGFLPQFFILSRISFELISQLTWVSAAVFLVWLIFHHKPKIAYFEVAVCGLIIGSSIYTYATGRLLSILMLISLWVIYFNRDNLKKLLVLTSFFTISLIPYVIFALNNPGALTARFSTISYIYESIPITSKISIFINNYLTYWLPQYLIIKGDANLRHSTGYGGTIFVITWLLFLLGLISILSNKSLITNKFNIFLLINLFISPIAAALTSEGTPHSLRSLLLSYYILLISCYGLNQKC